MKEKIASSFGLLLLSSGLFFGFNFFIAKVLGSEFYGQISYYLSFVQILILATSFNYAALYMGNKITREDQDAFSLFVSMESLMFVLSLLPAYWLIKQYVHDQETVWLIMSIAYVSVIASTVGLEYNAQKKVSHSIAYSTLIPRTVLVLFFGGGMIVGMATPKNYLYVYLFGFISVALYAFIRFRPVWYVKKEFFVRAWKFYLLGVIGTSVTYVAQIAQKEYGNYTELASLSIGLLLIGGLGLVGSILIKFALPKIHEAWKEEDTQQLEAIYTTHTFLSGMVNLPILIFLLFFIQYLSGFIGAGYETLPMVFYILSVGYFFDLMTGISGTMLRATEHEYLEIYNEIFRFVVGMGLIYLLRNQAYGIAYAISASLVAYNIIKYFQIFRLFGIKPITSKHLGLLSISLVILLGMLFGVHSTFRGYSALISGVIVMMVFYCIIYAVIRKNVDLGVYR